MDRYVRVEQRKTDQQSIQENEVRIVSTGKMRNYITYATALFTEKGQEAVVLKAMGKAINKAVTVVEIIKRRIAGLHQNTVIDSVDITDTWEPLEEGLSRLETTRHVSMIMVTLSKAPLEASLPGYQRPIAAEHVKPFQPEQLEDGDAAETQDNSRISTAQEDGETETSVPRRGRGRGRGRGPRAGRQTGRPAEASSLQG